MRTCFNIRMVVALCACALPSAALAQITLYTAVDLARRNSPAVHIAQADVQRATAALAEVKDAYMPSFALGSAVGYSYGFPVGQPSIYNLQANSLVLSFAQPSYIRAGRASLHTAQLNLQDSLDQVALDTTLDYVQLDSVLKQLAALNEQKQYAARLDSIEQQRVDAGVESRLNATRAELTAAQADLKRLDLESQAEVLRERLAHLTGFSSSNMIPVPESIPGDPMLSSDNVIPPIERVAGVQAGFANATSKLNVAKGDSLINDRPQLSLGVNYSRYAAFNNYQEYYLRFQHNNFDAGVQITLPFFDAAKRAKARQSYAEAAHAQVQAVQAQNQAAEQVVQLNGSLRELRAQQKVARLQSELAGEQVESITTQLANGSASPSGPALTPSDEMQARIAERQRYQEQLDADFMLLKAELSLLRSTGGLNSWIETATHNAVVRP